MWLEAESRMLQAMKKVNTVRRMKPLPAIVMDFGWARKTR
jgi:hypothetical protein